MITSAKLFKKGQSQAVRLPKGCRFKGKEVYVNRIGDIVIIMPKSNPWAGFVRGLEGFSSDFCAEREQPEQQERGALWPA